MGWQGTVPTRLLATLAIVAYAALAFVSALDRLAPASPHLASLVPGPLRYAAQRALVDQAIAEGDANGVLTAAEVALRREPLHPDAAAFLGTLRYEQGDYAGADVAYRVAAATGWRNLATQLYLYSISLQSGQLPLVADRADAILRVNPSFTQIGPLLQPLEESEEGRRLLVEHLARDPQWARSYYPTDPEAPAEMLRRRAAVAQQVAASTGPVGCSGMYYFTQTLLDAEMQPEAAAVWNAHCPAMAVAEGLTDGDFARLFASERSPFGWTANRSGDVSVRPGEGGKGVLLRNAGTATQLVLRQPLFLSPGSYRLEIDLAEVARTRRRGGIAATISCGYGAPLPPSSADALAGQELTAPACNRQILNLWVRPQTDGLEIANVRLVPAR